MSGRHPHLPALCLLLTASLSGGTVQAGTAQPAGLQPLPPVERSQQFVAVDLRQQQQAEQGFTRWLQGAGAEVWNDSPMQLLAGTGWQLLQEVPEQAQGRGLFALNRLAGQPLLLQAPHQYHDIDTGRLLRQLFEQGSLLAAGWNTAHRYLTAGSDLAHVEHSWLHAQALAFARQYPQALVLQLHGFASTPERAGVQAVVSNGTRTPSQAARRLAACLGERLQLQVRLYPEQIEQLGATTNRIGAALRASGFSGFLHLELEREVRRRLVTDASARQQLLACIQESRE